jgi:hypothetical protein
MKIQIIISVGLLVILGSAVSMTNAQSLDEPAVKILPTTQKGILKVHFAYHADQSVNVRFFNEEGQILSDEIKGTFPNGFSKKYNVRNITSKNFWIEVASENISVTYKLIESNDRQTFEPVLEKTAYNHVMVASKR